MYALRRVINSMRKFTHGSTMKHIVKEDFNNTQIPLPSLDKQKLIVNLLDKTSSLIQKRKETIKLADEFLRSTFLEMFGNPILNPKNWETGKLEDYIIGKSQNGYFTKNENYSDSGTPIIWIK